MGTQFQSALPLTRSSFKRRRSKPACAGKPCHRIERKCATASLIAKLSRETTMEIVANGLPSITARSRVPSRCLQNVSGDERATVKLPRDPASGPFALHGSRTRTHCRLRLRTEWTSLLPTAYTRRPPNVWVSRLPARQPRSTSSDRRAFTFLQHEGVSWNNNLAENAIKRVSDYRENVRRSVKEAGLTEYLVLLSLYQTCRLRNVSFLNTLIETQRTPSNQTKTWQNQQSQSISSRS